jgi:hypothetical protein
MRGKTREIVDRDIWGASPLRLAPPEDVKVTTRWSKKLGTKVRSSAAADEAYEFLIDLLGKDRIPNKKKVIAETVGTAARARSELAASQAPRLRYGCARDLRKQQHHQTGTVEGIRLEPANMGAARQTRTRCRRCVVPYTCWQYSKTDLRHAAQAASPQSPPHCATAPSFRGRGRVWHRLAQWRNRVAATPPAALALYGVPPPSACARQDSVRP